MSQEKNSVIDFLESDYYKQPHLLNQYFHQKAVINWRTSESYYELDLDGFAKLTQNMGKSFTTMTAEFHDVVCDNDKIVTNFTYFIESIESEDLHALAHFMAIWKLKDHKIIQAEIMSLPADDEIEVKKKI